MKMSAALLLALAVGAGASASSPPADASLALAPTGVEQKEDVDAIIADGLDPKHATVDKDDPLLFKHRFEHHDAATNQLTYYQYEARRHAHVVILDNLNATFCTYEEDEDDSSLLWLTLDVSTTLLSSTNLTVGSILTGHAGNCSALGTEQRQLLRDRVVSPPRVMPSNRRPDASTVTIQGRLADFHECFHHANIEYYQGEAESHGVFREKRLQSLVSNGRAVPDDGFARTDEILAAAKAKNAPANASVLTMAKVDKAAYNSTRTVESFLGASSTAVSTNGSSHGRELNHWLLCLPSRSMLDIQIFGTDCTNTPTNSALNNNQCLWNTNGVGLSLKPGNTYTVKWKSWTTQRVSVAIRENDPLAWQDCQYLASNRANQYYTGNVANSPNSITFTLGDNWGCGGRGLGDELPDFSIDVWTVSGAAANPLCAHWDELRFAEARAVWDSSTEYTLPLPSNIAIGNPSLGAKIQCDNCKVSVRVNSHLLLRIAANNPFSES